MATFKTQYTEGHGPTNMSDAPTGPLHVAMTDEDGNTYATFVPEAVARRSGCR